LPGIITLDIEASGIHPHSYPIEIGVVLDNGESWCSLIKPAETWTYWDDDAELLHGISRAELQENGKSPIEVAGKLNNLLQDNIAYSDCWVLDNPWLITLFQQAAMEKKFTLLDMMHIMKEAEYGKLKATKQAIAIEANIDRHRASNDARILQIAYQTLTQAKN
jgi:hypothetical protein